MTKTKLRGGTVIRSKLVASFDDSTMASSSDLEIWLAVDIFLACFILLQLARTCSNNVLVKCILARKQVTPRKTKRRSTFSTHHQTTTQLLCTTICIKL